MKKLILSVLMCLMTLSMHAQRCAVLEFKAGVGISQADVDGISAIFITYFRPAGYTMVERTQIDKAIDEQGFQRSKMTESQMVRIGQILNVSKIVVGDVNIVMGQYNVDARVINVESGTIAATEGATFAGTSYRTTMQSIAQKLAGKIAIISGSTIQPTPAQSIQSSQPRKRSSVEVIYGYLKVFPNELGIFESEPSYIIAQINKQAQHGYNNWRIPTNEELSLLRANNYLGSEQYMTKERKNGIVLLVSDGEDYATIQKVEAARKAEEAEARKIEEARKASLRAQGYVDLGLPSGTLWKNQNESGGYYSYEQAVSRFGNNLPTEEQMEELIKSCRWIWTGKGYKVDGPSGESITLSAMGYRDFYNGDVYYAGSNGNYWSSKQIGDRAVSLYINSHVVDTRSIHTYLGLPVRLVKK